MKEAFEVVTIKQEGPHEWVVDGRAYIDINMGDRLTSSTNSTKTMSVIGISTYGKHTDLLSTMMTGTLTLEGDMYSDLKFLYVS